MLYFDDSCWQVYWFQCLPVVAQWGDAVFFPPYYGYLMISTCRFSLSSAQDHTIACVPQGSYGSCLWVNSLMWLGNSSTAISGSIVKKHGQMFMEHSMRKIWRKQSSEWSSVYPILSAPARIHTRIIPPPCQPNIAFFFLRPPEGLVA